MFVMFGVALALLSALTWLTTKLAPEAGDVASIESRLAAGPATTSPTTIGPDNSVPRFSVGGQTARPSQPVGIRIPDIDKVAPVLAMGVEPNGEMEIPSNVDDVAWYKFGPSPGQPGSAVLAGHVDLESQGPGVFYELRLLEPGALIFVDYDDGSTRAFRVSARQTYLKNELPLDLIFSNQDEPILTLITCGGDFNQSVGSYDSNVVVYAQPIEPRAGQHSPA